MSSQTHQTRVRSRNVSPGSTKQGPMKATVPVSLMRQPSSPTKTHNKKSPSNSPTTWVCDSRVKSRRSPDNRISPERRSLGSPGISKEKSRTLNTRSTTHTNSSSATPSPVIRRTASLDAIYLTGQWPKDIFKSYCGHLMMDKTTQTPEEWDDISERKRSPQKKTTGNTDQQLEKFIRHRLQRTKEAAVGTHSHHHHSHYHHHHHPHTSPVQGDHSAISVSTAAVISTTSTNNSYRTTVPIPISKPLIPRMRNSVEGLSQEIQKLVLKGISGSDDDYASATDRIQEPTPDGHRAPIADLFLAGKNVLGVTTAFPSNTAAATTATAVHNGSVTLTNRNDADTQTPCSPTRNRDVTGGGPTLSEESGSSTTSSGTGSRCQSASPLVPIIAGPAGCMDSSRPPSHSDATNTSSQLFSKESRMNECKCESPELDGTNQSKFGTSPHINKFLAREPPDGCERVIVDETKRPAMIPDSFCPMKPNVNFVLKPSLCSAFCPLDKNYFVPSDVDTAAANQST